MIVWGLRNPLLRGDDSPEDPCCRLWLIFHTYVPSLGPQNQILHIGELLMLLALNLGLGKCQVDCSVWLPIDFTSTVIAEHAFVVKSESLITFLNLCFTYPANSAFIRSRSKHNLSLANYALIDFGLSTTKFVHKLAYQEFVRRTWSAWLGPVCTCCALSYAHSHEDRICLRFRHRWAL